MGENVQVPELRRLLSAIQGGTELVVVDPRYSSIAAKASHYLPVKPGTDTALLLGWLHHIVSEELYDREWVEENTTGFAELQEHLQEYPLHRVARITGIPVRDIRRTAELLAYHAPATIIHPGGHLSWYGNDVQRVRAQAVLTALLGGVGKPGSLQFPPDVDLPPAVTDFNREADNGGPSFSDLTNRMLDKKVKVVGIWGQNPFQNHPAPYKTVEAFKSAEFVFCCDVLPGEACLYADIILPEATFLERLDILDVRTDLSQPLMASRFPVVKPHFETKDPYWIVRELNNQLGRNSLFSHEDARSFLDSRIAPLGFSLKHLRSDTGIKVLGGDHALFADQDSQDEVDEIFALTDAVAVRRQYTTASGRIELYASSFANQGFDPLPVYNEVSSPPAGYVRLLYGRSPVHTLTSTQNNPWLNHEIAENDIWVNTTHAARLGISDGDMVYLDNQDGFRSLKPIRVKVTPGIRSDCVYMVHGYGCRSTAMEQGFNRGVSDTSLMTRSSRDPVSGVRGMRGNFVKLVPLG